MIAVFSLFLNIRGFQKGPRKFFMGILKSPAFFCQLKSGSPVSGTYVPGLH